MKCCSGVTHRNYFPFFCMTIPRSCFFFFFFFFGGSPLLFPMFLTLLFFPFMHFFLLAVRCKFFFLLFLLFFSLEANTFFFGAEISWIDYSSDRIAKSTSFSFQEKSVASITTPIRLQSEVESKDEESFLPIDSILHRRLPHLIWLVPTLFSLQKESATPIRLWSEVDF